MMKETGEMPMGSDPAGIHSLVKGQKPSPEEIKEMEKAYRENIRKSPIWDVMVNEYGKEKAEELLLEFKVNIE